MPFLLLSDDDTQNSRAASMLTRTALAFIGFSGAVPMSDSVVPGMKILVVNWDEILNQLMPS